MFAETTHVLQHQLVLHWWSMPWCGYILQVSSKSIQWFRSHRGSKIARLHGLASGLYNSFGLPSKPWWQTSMQEIAFLGSCWYCFLFRGHVPKTSIWFPPNPTFSSQMCKIFKLSYYQKYCSQYWSNFSLWWRLSVTLSGWSQNVLHKY